MGSAQHVGMKVEWRVPIGQTRPIMMALQTLAADTRSRPGCIGCSVWTDLTNGGIVRYSENWRSEDDLRRRLQSETFMDLITLIEDAIQPPKVEFTLASGARGLDFVAEVRQSLA